MSKAEKSDICIEWDSSAQALSLLLSRYEIDKKEKGYEGPAVSVLEALSRSFVSDDGVLIGHAVLGTERIAGIMVLCHGQSATYQVGWMSRNDRRYTGAHNLLLWQVLDELKNRNIKYFDLGGINSETAKGVQNFKSGMGGQVLRIGSLYH